MNNVRSEHFKIIRQQRKFVIQVLALLFAIVGVVMKSPDFFQWLFDTFPNLHLYGIDQYFRH